MKRVFGSKIQNHRRGEVGEDITDGRRGVRKLAEAAHLTEHKLERKIREAQRSLTLKIRIKLKYTSQMKHPNLRRELEQACQEVESASVRHADHNVSDPAVGRLVEKLIKKPHHALCSLSSITLHSSKLGRQKVVEFLQVVRGMLRTACH